MTEETPKRRPRNKRVAESERPPMQLTPRDGEIIKTVNDCRIMRGEHLEALFFTSRSAAQYRLQRLYQHEFLDRHFRAVISGGPASSPALYTLGKRGAALLATQYGYDRADIRLPKREGFSWQFIDHHLLITDVRVAVLLSARHHNWTVEQWLDETYFRAHPDYVALTDKRGKPHHKPVFPDAYFCLQTPRGKARFFLEMDRGTEQLARFAPQIRVYEAYIASGQYQERFAAKSLRILVIAPAAKRLRSLKAVTRKVGGDRKYWFTTMDRLTPDTILTGTIWQQLEGNTLLPLIDGAVP